MYGATVLSKIKNHIKHTSEKGQALVESAIVIPLMTFIILGVLQLTMIQHARLMTEYAAFNAARAGIVWNADKYIMENAAIISLLPTFEGLINESSAGNPEKMVMQVIQRALIYQAQHRIAQASDLIRNGTDAIIGMLSPSVQGSASGLRDALLSAAESAADTALRGAINSIFGTQSIVEIEVVSPKLSSFSGIHDREIDFDAIRGNNSWRDSTRLSINLVYLYTLKVPFANRLIHTAYIAGQVGKDLYGAVWNPQMQAGETGFRNVSPVSLSGSGLTGKLWAAAQKGVYMIPLRASYSMRMQSNPYRRSVAY